MSITAEAINSIMAKKHSSDVYVPECNTGSASKGGIHRFDAWVLKSTWSPVTTVGYEFKVSRSDFLNDKKWPMYLPLCNEFSWVCPYGLIQPNEVSEGCGLMYLSKNGNRVYTKIKAPRRTIEPPWQLLVYVLMSRASIDGQQIPQLVQSSTQYWNQWLEHKKENRFLGSRVNQRLRDIVNTYHHDVLRMQDEVGRLESVDKALKNLGIDISDLSTYQAVEKVEKLVVGELATNVNAARMEKAARSLNNAAEVIHSFWREHSKNYDKAEDQQHVED